MSPQPGTTAAANMMMSQATAMDCGVPACAQSCGPPQSGNAEPLGSWAEYAARNAPAMIE